MISPSKTIILLIFLSQSVLFSQGMNPNIMPKIGIIKGTVVDSINNTPIQYASLSLVNPRSKEVIAGGITNENGKFNIIEIPAGKAQLIVEYIGYKPVIMALKFSPRDEHEFDLGVIKLHGKAIEMNEVAVEGERPLFVQTMEKRTFNVAQNTMSSGGSALEALRQVPGVDVDLDGNVSLRGSANVNILIDGKPSNMAGADTGTLLENISADNVEDIEVVTNPSAKYDPEGMAGIINIVLKENKLAGLNGNVKSGKSSNKGINASGQINYKQEKLNVFLNTGFRDGVRGGSGQNYRETYYNLDTTYLDQKIDDEHGGKSISLKSGADYALNSKNNIGMALSWNSGSNGNNRDIFTDEMNGLPIYNLDSKGERTRDNIDVGFSYDKKFNKPKQMLNVLYDQSYREYNSVNQSGSRDQINYPDSTNSNTKSNDQKFQIDYIHPFSKALKLEAGLKSSIREIDNEYNTYIFDDDNVYILDAIVSDRFIYNEAIHAGYAIIGLVRENISGQLGVRGEFAEIISKLTDTGEEYKNPYTSIYPSASFSVGPASVAQLIASYSHRVNRPNTRHLNPSIRQIDPSNIRFGNPFLKPEYIDVYELTVSRFVKGKSVSLGGYYRNVTDMIEHYKYIEDGITKVTYENFDEKSSYGAEFILSGKLSPKLRIMMNANLYYDEVNANNIVDNYSYISKGINGRLTATYLVQPTMEMMFTGFYRAPRTIPFGTIESMSTTSLSIKKRLMDDKFAVSMQFRDLFNTLKFVYDTGNDLYIQHSERQWESQVASISLEYRFGKIEDRSKYGKRNRNGNDMEETDFEIE